MALQPGSLREALLDAGARPEMAGKAAEEVAAYEGRIAHVDGRLTFLTWMVGTNMAMTAAMLAHLLTR